MLVILLTSLIGYFVNKKLTGYGYRHREEEGEISRKLWYQIRQPPNYTAAKDIRIFGMKPWMQEITDKAMTAYTAFHRRAHNVYIWGSILDLVLTLLRNGLAYYVLIYLVLSGDLSVSCLSPLLFRGGGFTAWVTGILGSMTTLYRQSLDISTIREFLEYKSLSGSKMVKSFRMLPVLSTKSSLKMCFSNTREQMLIHWRILT